MTLPPEFTSHNIELPDGTHTRPGAPLLSGTGICRAALRDLWAITDGTRTRDVTVADLGCLEGGYAVEFARAGYQVTGIEARSDNFACCEHVAHEVALPNLTFQEADVRDWVAGTEPVDAVFCCGLLYHLFEPAKFLSQLGQVTRRLLILDTHYSVHPDSEHEGRAGHFYPETTTRWSSHGNEWSFWMTKPELLDAMHEAGFGLVYEQFDFLTSIRGAVYLDQHGRIQGDRGMFVGIKP